MAHFQPNWLAMKALSQPQVAATISTGGAANEVSVPPIEILTNSTPSATYFKRSGMADWNTRGRSSRAASVMAAGSVMSEPTSGTRARQTQVCATAIGAGISRAAALTAALTACSSGREPATTMMTKTNSGSV
jgi:hypothetical protein